MTDNEKMEFCLPEVMFDTFAQLQAFVIDGNFLISQCEIIFKAMAESDEEMARNVSRYGLRVLDRFKLSWARVVEAEMHGATNMEYVSKYCSEKLDNKKE